MTLFFNWRNLVEESKGNPVKLVEVLQQYKNKRILKPGLTKKLKGTSFLIAPDAVLNDKTTDILYIYQYIALAAKRDYTLYSLYGLKSLQLSYYTDINLDSIRTNPLLSVTKTEIHFKYEE